MEELKKHAEAVNTDWFYYLDVDGDDSDVFIHFFKRIDWFKDAKKVKPSADDIMKYRIIIPTLPTIQPPSKDWDVLFSHGCMVSDSSKKKVSEKLDDWGFINVESIKEVSEKDEAILCL